MANVDVSFSSQIRGVSGRWVKNVLLRTLKAQKVKKRGVSVLLTNNSSIRKLNKLYLAHDWATDVIAFGYGDSPFLGDIVVSVEMAHQIARKLKLPFRQELARYLIHGVLHLLGFDDKRSKDKVLMHKRQEMILKKVLA